MEQSLSSWHKEIFCKYLRRYLELEEKIRNASDALKELSMDFGGLYIDDLSMIPEILSEWFEGSTEDSWTLWWLFECDAGRNPMAATVNGREFSPKTPEELFELILFWKEGNH